MTLSTLDFLRLVTPVQGDKFISVDPGKARGGWVDRAAGTSHEEMARAVKKWSNQYGDNPVNIYHALAGFIDHNGRKADRAAYFKALWLDIDVGKKSGRCYESAQEAATKAVEFYKSAGLPTPSITVSSGKGIHVYWCFNEDVEAAQWIPMAEALKKVVIAHGLEADLTVIADRARVLRPIGTLWNDVKEYSGEQYPVKLWHVKKGDPTYTVDELSSVLLGEIKPQETQPVRPKIAVDLSINDTLGSPSSDNEFKGADPLLIAEQCGQIKRFSEDGNLPYEIWRLCIGVLARCDEEKGLQYAHEWSAKGFSGYDPAEVEAKFRGWNATGGTRCETFRKEDPTGPCATCTIRCNSPMALGYGGGAKPVTYHDVEENKPVQFDPITFPDEARIHKAGHLEWKVFPRATKNEPNPPPVWAQIANVPFYLDSLAVNQDGTLESDVVFFPRPGQRKDFVLSHSMAQSPRDLKKVLNAQSIFVQPHIEHFVVSYLNTLKQHVQDTPTHQQMGWIGNRNEFLIGDKLITKDEIRTVRVAPSLKTKGDLLDMSKPAEEWAEAVDKLYNLPNGQPYQFAVCAPFASILVPILAAEEYNGIPIALTSDESGYGKSTVCKIGLAAFGRVERNKNVLTGDEASSGAIEVQCSTFNNVSHLLDEMTNKSGQETSHILYMLSNGVARARLKQDGTPRPASPPWGGIPLITGNKNILLKLTESRVNPEAAQMRVFEIPLENYPQLESLSHASDFIEVTNAVRSGYGAVGVRFIRGVMKRRQSVRDRLWTVVNSISKMEDVRHGKERFYIYTIACDIVAAEILSAMGLIKFDVISMLKWALSHMTTLREAVEEHQKDADEDFGVMLTSFAGRGQVLSTFHDYGQNGSEVFLRGAPVIRLQRGSRKAFMSVEGFIRYCQLTSKSPSKFRQELVAANCFDPSAVVDGKLKAVKFRLGDGIIGVISTSLDCYRLNYDKVIGPLEDAIPEYSAKVVPISEANKAAK